MTERGDFGTRLRASRLTAKLSQEKLAEQSGVSVRAISGLERGKTRFPHPGSVHRLADALDLTSQARVDFVGAANRRLPGISAGRAAPADGGRVVPRQLPPSVPTFAGRNSELATLSRLLTRPGGTAVITAIGGTAGVGKTTLALHWGHLVAAEFPDGQLHVNLHGFGPSDTPVSPGTAVRLLLEGLDVPTERLPHSEEEQLDLYHRLLVGKRMLIVLDNARDEEQVRPLLPRSRTCRVVVTSRNLLGGLTSLEAAHPLLLDVLTEAEAWDLLEQRLGPERLHAADDATYRLIKASAFLPLALSVIAARAALRPHLPVADIVAELSESQGLAAFTVGEPAADVRAVLSWSYRLLEDDAARIFRLAGLHPGADFDRYAAAALTGVAIDRAERMLTTLAAGCLIQETGPGRYGMHDLLREYARELAAVHETADSRRQALAGLFDYYRVAASAAMDVAFPAEAHRRPRIAVGAAVLPATATPDAARAWLDQERANLVAVVVHSDDHGFGGSYAAHLAATLYRYLLSGNHLPQAHTLYSHALRIARRYGDLAAEASALNGLGGIAMWRSQFRAAADHYRGALELYRECGDRAGQARALHNLAIVETQQNDYRSAVDYYREAIAAHQDAGDRLGAAIALSTLASAEIDLGSLDQAAEHLQSALQVFREVNDQFREAEALRLTGEVSLRRGDLTWAADFFGRGLAIYRSVGFPLGIAEGIRSLGEVGLRQGDVRQAISYLRHALTLYRECSYAQGEIQTLRNLAEALYGAGQPAAARAELVTALRLAAETGNPYQQANSHRDLAESHHRDGQDKQARHHWQQALTLYTELGSAEADQVRDRLSPQRADGVRDRT
jgi:tetratricopeptide (TPR) repeat protein/transcriptional regulator with XRE-family HTH domain